MTPETLVEFQKHFTQNGIYLITAKLAPDVEIVTVCLVQNGKLWGTRRADLDDPDGLALGLRNGAMTVELLKPLDQETPDAEK